MKKIAYLLMFALLLGGCSSITVKSELVDANNENLSKLSVGMSEAQVDKIMKKETYRFGGVRVAPMGVYYDAAVTIKNPYKSETLQSKEETSLDVKYYFTSNKGKAKEIDDNNLTPVVFEKGKMVGWGWDFLKEKTGK